MDLSKAFGISQQWVAMSRGRLLGFGLMKAERQKKRPDRFWVTVTPLGQRILSAYLKVYDAKARIMVRKASDEGLKLAMGEMRAAPLHDPNWKHASRTPIRRKPRTLPRTREVLLNPLYRPTPVKAIHRSPTGAAAQCWPAKESTPKGGRSKRVLTYPDTPNLPGEFDLRPVDADPTE